MSISPLRTTRILPKNITVYQTLGPWSGEAIPHELFSRHSIDAGFWGELHIISGRVQYISYDSAEKFPLHAGDTHIIIPQEWHYLSLPQGSQKSDLRIQITFYKAE